MTKRSFTRGFTLVEVMVALAVFVVVSTVSYRGLVQAMEIKARLQAERRFWFAASVGFLRLKDDLSSARADQRFSGDASAARRLEFVAAPVMGAAPRRIAYEFSGRTLWRLVWPTAVSTSNAPVRSALLTDLDSLDVRFLSATSESPVWPATATGLPRGVEFTIHWPGKGGIARAFALPS